MISYIMIQEIKWMIMITSIRNIWNRKMKIMNILKILKNNLHGEDK
jgi:hypothetical protein